jgi:hypothetical protein
MKSGKFKKGFKQTFVYILRCTTKVDDFKDDDLNIFFKEAYEDIDNDFYLMFMSMINSVFTHMSKTFIMSRKTLYYICLNDLNLPRDIKVHSGNYSTFLSFCFEKGYITRLREPTGRKGGVYQIVDVDIVKKLNEIQGKMFFQEQEDYVLKAYDSNEVIEGYQDVTEDELVGTKQDRRAKLLKRLEDNKENV